MVVGAAERVERGGGGVGAEADGAALVRGRAAVEGASEHDRVAGRPEQLAHAGDQPLVRRHVGAAPVEDDGVAVDRTRLSGSGRSSLIRYQSTLWRASQDRAKPGAQRRLALRIGAADLAQQLDVAERRAALAVVEVEIVDAQGLLVDGVVRTRGSTASIAVQLWFMK